MVTFNNPLFLTLAVVLAGAFLLVSTLWIRLQVVALRRFGSRLTLERFSSFSAKPATAIVIALTLALLSLAAAEPTLSNSVNAGSPTLNAVIVMDISRSMLAEDGLEGRTRLATGILAVERLLETYPDGRFGLVLYTNEVVAYSPTFDHQAIRQIFGHFQQNYSTAVRGEGSAPALALDAAATMIGELSYPINVVMLISDGGLSRSTNVAQPRMSVVVDRLSDLHVRIVAAGVGGLLPTAIPDYNENGELVGYHRLNGAVAYTALDETSLSRFAADTSGLYLRLTNSEGLVQVSSDENLDTQPTATAAVESLVWIPTAAALLLVTLWLVGNRISSRRPRTPF